MPARPPFPFLAAFFGLTLAGATAAAQMPGPGPLPPPPSPPPPDLPHVVQPPPPPAPPAPPVRVQPAPPAPGPLPPGVSPWTTRTGLPLPPAEVPPEAPAPPPPALPGVTAKGLPYSSRGGLFVEVAALRTPENGYGGVPVTSMDLTARIPVADHTFVDAVLPIGFSALGNPMVGAHHVFRPADRVWITLGGAVGFPVLNGRDYFQFQAARTLWDMHEFAPYVVPFVMRFGLEAHAGIMELRAELDPLWGISTRNSSGGGYYGNSGFPHLFALQHAFEAQIGHAFGGGVRYQGVAVATPQVDEFDGNGDHYQGTVELFLRLFRDPIYARVGFALPLDNPLGAGNDGARAWAVRAQLGWTLD